MSSPDPREAFGVKAGPCQRCEKLHVLQRPLLENAGPIVAVIRYELCAACYAGEPSDRPFSDELLITRFDERSLASLEVCRQQYGIRELADFTCFRCPARNRCELAWDAYNTQGDCLAEK